MVFILTFYPWAVSGRHEKDLNKEKKEKEKKKKGTVVALVADSFLTGY